MRLSYHFPSRLRLQQILLQFYKAHLTQDYTSIKELTTDQFFPVRRQRVLVS